VPTIIGRSCPDVAKEKAPPVRAGLSTAQDIRGGRGMASLLTEHINTELAGFDPHCSKYFQI
jgi:hypothetical protein